MHYWLATRTILHSLEYRHLELARILRRTKKYESQPANWAELELGYTYELDDIRQTGL